MAGGRSFTGKQNFGGFNLSNIGDPVVNSDASARGWTISQINSSPATGSADMSWNTSYPLLAGGRSFTGKQDFGGFNLSHVGTPILTTDAATWGWVVTQLNSTGFIKTWDDGWNTSYPLLAGGRSFTGKQDFGGFNLSNVGNPVVTNDAATWSWTIGQINSSPSTGTADMSWNSSYPLLAGSRVITGKWNFGGFNISNISDPVVNADAAARGWTISQINSSPSTGTADMSWNTSYPLLTGSRTLTGKWNFGGYNISNVGNPILTTDAATWGWVVTQINSSGFIKTWDNSWNTSYPLLAGGRAFTGKQDMGGYNVSNIGDPVVNADAAARGWTITQINSSPSTGTTTLSPIQGQRLAATKSGITTEAPVGLNLTMSANQQGTFQAFLRPKCSSATNTTSFYFRMPSGNATGVYSYTTGSTTGGSKTFASGTAYSFADPSGGGDTYVIIDGQYLNGVTPGNMYISIARTSAPDTASMTAGSYIIGTNWSSTTRF